MSSGKLTKEQWAHVNLFSTDAQVIPLIEWVPAEGIDTVRATMKIKAASGTDLKLKLAMQCALVRPSDPTDWQALGSSYTSAGNGETPVSEDVASTTINTSDNFWVRFGVFYKIDSGTSGEADVSLQCSYEQQGRVIGHLNQQLLQANIKDKESFIPIGPFVPLVEADEVKLTTIMTSGVFLTSGGDVNKLGLKLAWRTADTSPESPGNWSTTFSAGTNTERVANEEKCSGELTPTYSGTPMWVQFGLWFQKSQTSGSSEVTGTVSSVVSAAVAIRKT